MNDVGLKFIIKNNILDSVEGIRNYAAGINDSLGLSRLFLPNFEQSGGRRQK